MDVFTPEKRSAIMKAVPSKHTNAEMQVRRLLHRLGYRFRLHRRDLPGTPDIVFAARRKIVIVNGCFWHQHKGCRRAKRPSTNEIFWNDKLEKNLRRDRSNQRALRKAGWNTFVVWECQLKNAETLAARLIEFLER